MARQRLNITKSIQMAMHNFEVFDITRQQELVETHGKFLQTETVGNYIYDTYLYDSFYVVFYCLIARPGEPHCRCFLKTDHIEDFIKSLNRLML